MVLPSDVVEQDPDMEALEGNDGAESMADAPTEGAVVPMETETGEVPFKPFFQQCVLIRCSMIGFKRHINVKTFYKIPFKRLGSLILSLLIFSLDN